MIQEVKCKCIILYKIHKTVVHSDYRFCRDCGCPYILLKFAELFCSWYYDEEIELMMERPRFSVKIDGLWALGRAMPQSGFDVDLHFTLASLVFSRYGHRFEEKNYILTKLAKMLRQIRIPQGSLLTDLDEIYDFILEWQLFKREHNLFEFNDLLVEGLKHDINSEVLIIDEFQDLSALQYALVERWCEKLETVIIAGDYNQSIYGFQGGSPDFLLDFENENKIVLNHTFRMSKQVLGAAKAVLQDKHGFEDVYSDREDGDVTRLDMKEIDLGRLQREYGSVFVLARTNSQLKMLKRKLRYPKKISDYDYGIYLALHSLLLEKADKVEFIRLIDRVSDKETILDALDQELPPERLRSVVEFKTIHASKGLEADAVVLFDQEDRKTVFSEEERRVFYVGISRSRGPVILFSEHISRRTVYLKMVNPVLQIVY